MFFLSKNSRKFHFWQENNAVEKFFFGSTCFSVADDPQMPNWSQCYSNHKLRIIPTPPPAVHSHSTKPIFQSHFPQSTVFVCRGILLGGKRKRRKENKVILHCQKSAVVVQISNDLVLVTGNLFGYFNVWIFPQTRLLRVKFHFSLREAYLWGCLGLSHETQRTVSR